MSKLDKNAEQIRADIKAGVSQREIAKREGVARSTLQHFLDKPTTDAARVEDIDLIKADLKDVKARLRKQVNLDVQAEKMLRTVREAVSAEPVRYTPPEYDPEWRHKGHVQALLLSDTHVGEVVTPDAVGGMNEYNWDICLQRLANIQKALLSFQANRPYPIEELQIWNLGDMVGGAHHLELAVTNEFPEAEQSYRWGMAFGGFVESLVPHFPRIVLEGVEGNHARVPQKPANKQIFNSFDWLSYKISETYLSGYIEAGSVVSNFDERRGPGFQIARIAGRNVLLFHGDGIRSSMPGVPWGGVMRRVAQLRQQYAHYGERIDGFCLGHFHQANAVSGPVWMNGSVKGPDEYCLKQFGSADPPEQLLLTFDPKRERRTDVSYINP